MLVRGLPPAQAFLVAAGGGRSPVAVPGPLAAAASPVQSAGSRHTGSSAVAHGLTLRHVGSSQTRGQTHVPFTGRQILVHGTTREVPSLFLSPIRASGHFSNICLF